MTSAQLWWCRRTGFTHTRGPFPQEHFIEAATLRNEGAFVNDFRDDVAHPEQPARREVREVP